MNIPYVALKNLKRKPTRTWLLLSKVAVLSCTLFAATFFLKSANNALQTKVQTTLLSGEPTQFLMNKSVLDKGEDIIMG